MSLNMLKCTSELAPYINDKHGASSEVHFNMSLNMLKCAYELAPYMQIA